MKVVERITVNNKHTNTTTKSHVKIQVWITAVREREGGYLMRGQSNEGLSNSPIFNFFKMGLYNVGGYLMGGLSTRFYGTWSSPKAESNPAPHALSAPPSLHSPNSTENQYTCNARIAAKIFGKIKSFHWYCCKFFNVFVGSSQWGQTDLLAELGKIGIRKHRNVPDQFVDCIAEIT